MNWKIEVYSASGTLKATYTPASPGGIVNNIKFSVEPSGNCLDGSFEGIPNQLNINVRDIVYIYPNNTTSYFAGYVKSAPNKNSSRVGTYNIEGLKKLIYDYVIDEFWFRSRDGNPVFLGNFTTFNSSSAGRIVRLTDTGAIDTSFRSGTGFSGNVNQGSSLFNSRFLISPNQFSATYNGVTVRFMANISEDGSISTTDQALIGTGPNGIVRDVKQTEEGRFYIAGDFSSYNETTRNRVARIFADGSLDTSFNPSSGADGFMEAAIPILSNNRCIFCGEFTTYNGVANTTKIVRVTNTGAIDSGFSVGTGFDTSPEDGVEDADGKVVLTGFFNSFNGSSVTGIVRLNTNGSRDTTFNSGNTGFGANTGGLKIVKDYRGRYVIGGNFTTYNGQTHNRIIRLNPDGSVDTTFNNGSGGFNGLVRDIDVYPDGRILVGGDFLTYKGASTVRVARLLEDGSRDTTFAPTTGANASVHKAILQRSPSGIVRHSSLIASLYPYFPPFIRGLRNQGSIVSGNRGPVVATGYSLGSIFDAIVASSQDDTYEWGVDGAGSIFVQKKGSSTVNFTTVQTKQITFNPENDDEIVTKVKFVFSVPGEYSGLTGHTQQNYSEVGRNNLYTTQTLPNNFTNIIEYDSFEAITYTYEDTDASNTYGKFTKIVPLALSESWTTLDTLASANRFASVSNRSGGILVTQDGGAPASAPLSTFGTGTFLTNNSVISTDAVFSFFTYTNPITLTTEPLARFSDQDEIIGMQLRFSLRETTRKLKFYISAIYAKAANSLNLFNSASMYEPSPDSKISYEDRTIRLLMPKAPLTQFVDFSPIDKNQTGLKNNDIRRLEMYIISSRQMNGYSGPFTDVPVNALKFFELFLIKLNKQVLDSFAKTIIKTPSNLSSTVRTFTLPTQNFQKAVVPTPSGNVTADVVRVNYNISNADGFFVEYVTGYDDQRMNEFIKRIAARDDLAKNNSFLNASGRSVL